MAKISKLKEWLSISDAARELSDAFEERVKDADVLQLALDGKLRISVRFAFAQEAFKGKLYPRSREESLGDDSFQGTAIEISPGEFYVVSESELLVLDDSRVVWLRSIADLPMIGNERNKVEAEYRRATGDVSHSWFDSAGTFVLSQDGHWHLLIEERPSCSYEDSDGNLIREMPPKNHPLRFSPATGLPTSSALVVRTSAIDSLVRTPGIPQIDETPEARRKRLAARKQELVRERVRNPTQQLAKEEGVSESRIRQLLGSGGNSDSVTGIMANTWPPTKRPTR